MKKNKLQLNGFVKFSKQETAVFKLLITEHKAHEISKLLGIEQKTVGTYKLRLLKKSKTKTIIGLYKFNLEHKIVSLD